MTRLSLLPKAILIARTLAEAELRPIAHTRMQDCGDPSRAASALGLDGDTLQPNLMSVLAGGLPLVGALNVLQ